MTRTEELDAIVSRHNLSEHPFYQEWVMGALPESKLRAYASEYGHFIETIADGWDSIGQHGVAIEERAHVGLWNDFRAALGADTSLSLAGTALLVEAANVAFRDRAASIGALYAFEAQQPLTASLKLEGLRAHYTIPESGLAYFEVHAHDDSEPKILLQAAEELTDEEFQTSKANCEVLAERMWNALTAVHRG